MYILGDFFEAYIGDDEQNNFLKEIKLKLRAFTRNGPPTYLMHGNRDFLIGKKFATETGVHLITDPTIINLYQQKILLMHGDSLCTADKSHQRFRKIIQSKITKKILLSLPLSFRKKLAKELRKESKESNQQKSTTIMDVTPEAVVGAIKNHQVKTMIHGHTHRCATHEFVTDNQSCQRIVLDAWHQKGHYLKIDSDGLMKNVHFSR